MRVTVCMSQLLRALSLRHFVLNLPPGILVILTHSCKIGLFSQLEKQLIVVKTGLFFDTVLKFSKCLKKALIEFVANESKPISMFFDRAVISSATKTHPFQTLNEVSA